jgi:hypothetical protein
MWTLSADNPAHVVKLVAPTPYQDQARTQSGGHTPSVHRTITAKDLFIKTVPHALERYEINTARIVAIAPKFSGSAACSKHADWSGKVNRWNETLVEYELHAPSIGSHWHGSGLNSYMHGGGGSKANLSLVPTFRVHFKGAPPTKPVASGTVELGHEATAAIPMKLPEGWSLMLSCRYKDGGEAFDLPPILLGPKDLIGSNHALDVKIANSTLHVTTRY